MIQLVTFTIQNFGNCWVKVTRLVLPVLKSNSARFTISVMILFPLEIIIVCIITFQSSYFHHCYLSQSVFAISLNFIVFSHLHSRWSVCILLFIVLFIHSYHSPNLFTNSFLLSFFWVNFFAVFALFSFPG